MRSHRCARISPGVRVVGPALKPANVAGASRNALLARYASVASALAEQRAPGGLALRYAYLIHFATSPNDGFLPYISMPTR